MAESHFVGGLRQRVQLVEEDDDAERTPEAVRRRLQANLDLIEQGFSPTDIEVDGAPDEVVVAGSGRTVEDIDVGRVAEYLATEKWNYLFDADISAGDADIGVDEAQFNLWYTGSVKVRGDYDDPESAEPGIRNVRAVYPERSFQFDAGVFSRKPADVQALYEDAVRAKQEAFAAAVADIPNAADILGVDDVQALEDSDPASVMDDVSFSRLNDLLARNEDGEAEYRRLARDAQARVVDDAADRFADYGIELGDDDFDSYEEVVEAVRAGETTRWIFDLQGPDGAPLQMQLYAEGGRYVRLDGVSNLGYLLRSSDEDGLETVTGYFSEHV